VKQEDGMYEKLTVTNGIVMFLKQNMLENRVAWYMGKPVSGENAASI
jgi:hypothetical protein